MPERHEIIAGLRNAVERGYSLELAIQSFINSGYNRQDVLDSARNINASVISGIPIQTQQFPQPPLAPQPQQQKSQPQPQQQIQPPKSQPQPQQQIQPPKSQPQPQQQIKYQPIQYRQPYQMQQKKNSKLGWIILLSGLLIILLAALVLFIFFKDKVLNFLGL